MSQFYDVFVYTFASLFSVVNPIGMSAVFLAMTKNFPPHIRYRMAYKVAVNSAILIIITFFLGSYVLKFFKISLFNIQIAGGLLIFCSAWDIFNDKPKISTNEKQEAKLKNSDITFFPLTMPITAGAGAIAVAISLQAELVQESKVLSIVSLAGTFSAIITVFIVVAICYRFSSSIFNKLGYAGTNIVSKISAFILLAISINLIWDGIKGLVIPILK
jgi:multiple antibiotic resistance protein